MASRFPLRSVGSKLQEGLPAYSTRAQKEPRQLSAVKEVGFLSARDGQLEMQRAILKGQHINFHMQPLMLGSAKEGSE